MKDLGRFPRRPRSVFKPGCGTRSLRIDLIEYSINSSDQLPVSPSALELGDQSSRCDAANYRAGLQGGGICGRGASCAILSLLWINRALLLCTLRNSSQDRERPMIGLSGIRHWSIGTVARRVGASLRLVFFVLAGAAPIFTGALAGNL